MRPFILAIAALMAGTAAADDMDVQKITATLPSVDAFSAPEAIENMQEGVVLLDLTMEPSVDPGVSLRDGTGMTMQACAFEPIDAETVSVPTGSNHILMEVRMGSPELHAANILSCDYSAAFITDEDLGHVTRLKGCFLAHATSIPTAVYWVLNPLPAAACGFGD